MLITLKRLYWRALEATPLLLKGLRVDPPLRRLSRFLQMRCRRTLNLDGIRVRLSPKMGRAAVAYMLQGRYEGPERRILECALKPGDRVLELGTGIGYLSAICARKLGNGNVLSFEANPMLQPLVEQTYALDGVSPRVEFCLLGDSNGRALFNVSAEFWASSTMRRKGRIRQITVPMKAFNDVITSYKPTFLIIDIEGGEADLIRFARLDNVEKVCIELHPSVIGADQERRVRH